MPPRIVTILGRLRQDLAAELSPEAIAKACREEKYSWRDRALDPATTAYFFLLQVLHGNTACQHVVHFGRWNFTDSAYCAARKRLPLGALRRLAAQVAQRVRTSATAAATWHGHRVWLIDGSSFSMPDTPELQKAFGQPGGRRKGCGFPVAKFLALFDLATGLLLRVDPAPLRSHEMAQCAVATSGLLPGDVVLGDRGFCSYAHLAPLLDRHLHGVFRAASAPDHRLHTGAAPRREDQGKKARRGDDPAALAVGAVAGRRGSGRRLVQAQAQAQAALDVAGGVRVAARRGRGARAALRGPYARIPRRRDHAGDDAPGGVGVPGGGAGGLVLPAVAGGELPNRLLLKMVVVTGRLIR